MLYASILFFSGLFASVCPGEQAETLKRPREEDVSNIYKKQRLNSECETPLEKILKEFEARQEGLIASYLENKCDCTEDHSLFGNPDCKKGQDFVRYIFAEQLVKWLYIGLCRLDLVFSADSKKRACRFCIESFEGLFGEMPNEFFSIFFQFFAEVYDNSTEFKSAINDLNSFDVARFVFQDVDWKIGYLNGVSPEESLPYYKCVPTEKGFESYQHGCLKEPGIRDACYSSKVNAIGSRASNLLSLFCEKHGYLDFYNSHF